MARTLPRELQAFLAVRQLEFVHVYQPAWIKGYMYGDLITVDFGAEPQAQGERRRDFSLNRRLFIAPDCNVSNIQAIESQLLLLLLSYVDGAIAPSRARGGVTQFWTTACHLVEYWLGSNPAGQFTRGLADLDSDTILEYLESYKALGIEGVLSLSQHWDIVVARHLEDWLSTEPPAPASDSSAHCDHRIARAMARAEEFGVQKDELPQLEMVVRFLIARNAYDSLGNVKASFASSLLGISSKRIACNSRFCFYLRRFSLAEDFSRSGFRLYGMRTEPNHLRKGIEQRIEQTGDYKIDNTIRSLRKMCLAAQCIPSLAGSDLANGDLIEEIISLVDRPAGGRTPSLPVSTALEFIRRSVLWVLEVGPALELVTEQICAEYRRVKASKRAFYAEMDEILHRLQSEFLNDFAVTSFWGRGRRCDPSWSVPESIRLGEIGYSDLLDLHLAICSSIVLLMACLRKSEYFDLADEHVDTEGELAFLLCGLRKRGIDEVRPTKRKPIPRIAQMALESQIKLRNAWTSVVPSVHGGGNHVLWRLTESGVSGSVESAALYKALDMMSEYFDLRAPNGRRWYIRPHQLRRCFALTFFHSGGVENVLPALSWHMGHRTIAETWRYIQEQLTGAEISAAEAQMATLAVLSPSTADAVEHLRSILRAHFGCDDLLVMDEEEMQDYLEFLHHEGVFTASPVDIREKGGRRVSILVSIRRSR